MSLWRNRVLILGCVISFCVVSACGFTPMRSKKMREVTLLGIEIDVAKDEMGQRFKQELEDRLNPESVPVPPKYELNVAIQYFSGAIGVARDGSVSRFNVTLTSNYILKDIVTNKVVKTGQIQHVSSFNNQANQYYSTYIAEKDAIKKGLAELSVLYHQRLTSILLKEKQS